MTMGKSICHVDKEVLIAWRDILTDMIDNYIEYNHGDWKEIKDVGKFPNPKPIEYPFPDITGRKSIDEIPTDGPDVSWDKYKNDKWDGNDIY